MVDTYIILNRKPKLLIRVFIVNIFFLTGLVIFCINTLSYQLYFQIHSQVFNLNSYYYLKVLIPVKEVNEITKQNKLWIDTKSYYYKVVNESNDITYRHGINYLTLYLKVDNLDEKYLRNGYHLDVKIKKNNMLLKE